MLHLHLTHRCLTVSCFLLSLAFCVSNNNKKESLEKKFYLWYRTVSLTFLSHWRTYGTGWSLGNSTWQLKTTPSPSMAVMCTASSAKRRRENNSILVQRRELSYRIHNKTNCTIVVSQLGHLFTQWTGRLPVDENEEGIHWLRAVLKVPLTCTQSQPQFESFLHWRFQLVPRP